MLCQQLWWLVPSLFLIIFFFWCFFPKSLLLTFHSGLSLESWPLIYLPSRLLHLIFSDLAFWLPFLLSFFPSELIPSLPGWKFSQLLPLRVLLSEFPEVPALCSWIVSLSNSFLHHWVADKGVSVLRSLCFWALLLSCLNLILALLHVPRTPSSWQSFGIPAQFL